MAPSKQQVKVMKMRLVNAANALTRELDSRIPNAEYVNELLDEIDGCSASIREYNK